MKSRPLFQQKKQASTSARRRTRISTPVAITTDAEQRGGGKSGHFPSAGAKTWICWMTVGSGSGIQEKKARAVLISALLDMFISFVP